MPAWRRPQVKPGVLYDIFESGDFCPENCLSKTGQPVISAPWIVVARELSGLLHHPAVQELAQVVVQGSGAELVASFGLTGDLLHDSVAVPIFIGQRKEDVEIRGREGDKRGGVFVHTRISLYRIPSDSSRGVEMNVDAARTSGSPPFGLSLAAETPGALDSFATLGTARQLRPFTHWCSIPAHERGSGFHPIPCIDGGIRPQM